MAHIKRALSGTLLAAGAGVSVSGLSCGLAVGGSGVALAGRAVGVDDAGGVTRNNNFWPG